MDSGIKYSIIIPVYNEETVIEQTYQRLKQVMDSIEESYELIFVNDGSVDNTESIIRRLGIKDKAVKIITFSRNFGHQIAITAGMDYALGAAIIMIDADLQDPPELILDMITKWKVGFEVVYAKRTKRKGETFFKKQTAHIFYRLMKYSTDIEIPIDTGDFRLIDRKVCEELKSLTEKNRYVRGLVSWVGFKQTVIEYERDERLAGETKYSINKMIKLSLDGITSFSYKPIKIASYTGITLIVLGLIYFVKLLHNTSKVVGWNIVVAGQLVLTGIILIMMGVIGEYIGRIYDETRDRPLYIISECYGMEKKERKAKNTKEYY